MRSTTTLIALLSLVTLIFAADKPAADKEEGFVPLFDGKTLDGWTPNEMPEAFAVEDGCIVCKTGFAHLFYTGDVNKHEFKNFELRAEFKFVPGSNSGIFFHTANEGKGLVKKGYECQICSDSHKDPRKTGSLYAIEDVKESAAKDDEWSMYTIRVEGKHITLKVNDKVTVDYTEPENPKREKGRERRVVSSGTFALQGHDPKSKTWFRNIRVKALPD
jgi:predicted RNA-binding protein with PUA-like domain